MDFLISIFFLNHKCYADQSLFFSLFTILSFCKVQNRNSTYFKI